MQKMRLKNTLEGTNSRIMEEEDRISEVENRMVKINEAERKRRKNNKRNENNLRDPWDNVKCPNIRIIGVPEEEEDKKKDHEKILEEIIVENFPKMGKKIATQVQETQRVPNRINPRRNLRKGTPLASRYRADAEECWRRCTQPPTRGGQEPGR